MKIHKQKQLKNYFRQMQNRTQSDFKIASSREIKMHKGNRSSVLIARKQWASDLDFFILFCILSYSLIGIA